MLDTCFIGIDVSSKSNVVHVMDKNGEKLWADSFLNSLEGTNQLLNRVCNEENFKDTFFVFGLEATGIYGKGLAMTLGETSLIPKSQKTVKVLNPKQVKRFHSSYSDLPKDDFTDAFVIADSLRFGRIAAKETVMQDNYLALQHLTRWRYQTAHEITREKNRYLQNLFLKFSSMSQRHGTSDSLFSNTFGATAMDLVNDFEDIDDIAYMPLNELVDYFVVHGKNHFTDPEAVAKEVQKAARSSYRLPKTVQDSVNQVLAMQTQTIKFYQDQLKAVDKMIETQMAVIPNTLTSIPGIGPVYASGLIAEIGDVNRFDNEAALAKYAGLTWTRHQSGDYESNNQQLIPGGNKFLRYYFCQAANKVRMHDPDYASYYISKLKEVRKTPHKRALVLTARKLVRLVYVLLRDGRLYQIQHK